MSDEDDNYMSEESYEFEFEEEEEEEEVVDEQNEESEYGTENKYYNAKCLKADDPQASLAALEEVVKLPATEDNIEWIFKSYKQLIKVAVSEREQDRAIGYLKKLVQIIPQVNSNYAEESISRMLSNYSSNGDSKFVSDMYDIILGYLNEGDSGISGGNGRRLWLKINMHKLNILVENKNWAECAKVTSLINENLKSASELTRNTYSLEVIAAEILIHSSVNEQGSRARRLLKLSDLYKRAMKITTAVTHPKIMGIIRECGAIIQFYRGNYESARLELYESFKNYDEAGSSTKKKILKYLALCSLLTENQFNPFESQETQTYAQLPEYGSLISLLKCYDDFNLAGFQGVMKKMIQEDDPIVRDDIFKHSSSKILYHLRSNILCNTLKSYRRIKLGFLARKLAIDQSELEEMVLHCINTGKLSNSRIDFIDDYIEIASGADRTGGGTGGAIPVTLDGEEVFDNMKCYDALSGGLERTGASSSGGGGRPMGSEIDIGSGGVSFEIGTSLPSHGNSPHQNSIFVGNSPTDGSTFEKFIFHSERAINEEKSVELINNWLKMLVSGIPIAVKEELTQKEQVIQEQKGIMASAVSNQLPVAGGGGGGGANATGAAPALSRGTSASTVPTITAAPSATNLTSNAAGLNTGPSITPSFAADASHLHYDDEEDEEARLDKVDYLRKWAKEIRRFQQVGNRAL